MRFLRRSAAPEPAPEQEVAVFHTEALRLLDYHWRRGDAFERKALGVLGFTGVIVALLVPNLKVVLQLQGNYRTAALILGLLAIIALAGSAIASAAALWARNYKTVSVEEVRRRWQAYLVRLERGGGYSDAWHTADQRRDLTEKLLHGGTHDEGPVDSMRRDADTRGRWFLRGVYLNLAALLLIAAVTVTTTLGEIS